MALEFLFGEGASCSAVVTDVSERQRHTRRNYVESHISAGRSRIVVRLHPLAALMYGEAIIAAAREALARMPEGEGGA